MSFKNYVLSLIIGVISFSATLVVLNLESAENATLNAQVFVIDHLDSLQKATLVIDTLTINNNVLALKKHRIENTFTQEEVEDLKTVTYAQLSASKHPSFLLWALLIAMTVSLSIAILPFLYHITSELISHLNKATSVGLTALAVLLLSLVFIISGGGGSDIVISGKKIMELTGIMLKHPKYVLTPLVIIMFLPSLFCLRGNLLVIFRLLTHTSELSIPEIVDLHKLFSKMLVISSISLVIAVVTTTLLRMSILELLPTNAAYLYPPQFVGAYGLIFTFFLIIFYLPGEYLLRIMVAQKVTVLPKEEAEAVESTIDTQSIFKLGLSILAPIIMGLLSEVLKFL